MAPEMIEMKDFGELEGRIMTNNKMISCPNLFAKKIELSFVKLYSPAF